MRRHSSVIQKLIEETRALTDQLNEFSAHWQDVDKQFPTADQVSESQKRQLFKAVSLFEMACKKILETP
jgi:hypothetical protein